MRKYVTRASAILLAVGLTASRAQAQSEELAWLVCPDVVDATVKGLMIALKTKLKPDELDGLGVLVCTSVELYQSYNSKRTAERQTPLSRHTAHEFFCIDPLYSQYCNKTPAVPPTFGQALQGGEQDEFAGGWAAQCLQRSPNAQSCAAAILRQAIRDAENR